jgi:hypothetical protein
LERLVYSPGHSSIGDKNAYWVEFEGVFGWILSFYHHASCSLCPGKNLAKIDSMITKSMIPNPIFVSPSSVLVQPYTTNSVTIENSMGAKKRTQEDSARYRSVQALCRFYRAIMEGHSFTPQIDLFHGNTGMLFVEPRQILY